MLAVVLSVGLVVDDAIVVTENIYLKIERGMSPKQAGIEGSKEIFFAVISTTITLVAVFFPIVFLEGMTGRLFREFSIVISGSVVISAFAALTFTPMLASKLLKRTEHHNWIYRKTEPFFSGMNNFYDKMLQSFIRHKSAAFPIIGVTVVLIIVLWNVIPSEMSPLEDRSQITIRTSGPEGATYEFLRDYNDEISQIADRVVPERESNIVISRSGFGMIRIILPDIDKRERNQMQIADSLTKNLRHMTEARAFVQQPVSYTHLTLPTN
jgi:multidrug efflux pump